MFEFTGATGWDDSANAIDGNAGTAATNSIGSGLVGDVLEIDIAPVVLPSDAVRLVLDIGASLFRSMIAETVQIVTPLRTSRNLALGEAWAPTGTDPTPLIYNASFDRWGLHPSDFRNGATLRLQAASTSGKTGLARVHTVSLEAVRQSSLREESAEDVLLTFAEIRHPLLLEPMRVVTDHLPYVWRGVEWQPVLFEFTATQDDDRPPEARISLPAIDQRIANALIDLPERARISFWILSSADFDLTEEPRAQIGDPVPLRSFLNLDLMDVQGNVSTASGRLMLRDTTQEPWPGIRATESRCPGLFA